MPAGVSTTSAFNTEDALFPVTRVHMISVRWSAGKCVRSGHGLAAISCRLVSGRRFNCDQSASPYFSGSPPSPQRLLRRPHKSPCVGWPRTQFARPSPTSNAASLSALSKVRRGCLNERRFIGGQCGAGSGWAGRGRSCAGPDGMSRPFTERSGLMCRWVGERWRPCVQYRNQRSLMSSAPAAAL